MAVNYCPGKHADWYSRTSSCSLQVELRYEHGAERERRNNLRASILLKEQKAGLKCAGG